MIRKSGHRFSERSYPKILGFLGHPIMQVDAGSNLLLNWIARAAQGTPEKPWVVSADDGRTVGYGALHETVRRFAAFLRERGLGPNDRVALLANNSIEHLLCYLGVMAAGATICTIHIEMNRNQLGNIFERLKPKLVLYQDGLQLDDLLAEAAAPRLRLGRFGQAEPGTLFGELSRCQPGEPRMPARQSDDAVILFTSGTSAKPKGVVLSYREFLLNIGPLTAGWGITAADRLYDFRPFQLELGADLERAWRGQPRRHADPRRKIFREPISSSTCAITARRLPPAIRPTINILLNSGANRQPRRLAEPALHHVKFGAADCSGIGSASNRNSASRSRRAAAPARWVDRRHARANSAASAPSAGRLPISTSPSSMPAAPACRPAKSAMWSLAAGRTSRSAISARMARSKSTAAAAIRTGDLGSSTATAF